MPNYTLKAPNDLTIYGASLTVQDATPLADLLKVNLGWRVWAACTIVRYLCIFKIYQSIDIICLFHSKASDA